MNGCNHKWKAQPEYDNFVCTHAGCGAIGYKDPRDQFGDGEFIILRPGRDDLAAMDHNQVSRWYTKHRALILADIRQLGETKTRHRWGIPTGTWSKLMKRFNLRLGSAGPALMKSAPAFPDFSDSWAPEVQIKWLDVYHDLFCRNPGSLMHVDDQEEIAR